MRRLSFLPFKSLTPIFISDHIERILHQLSKAVLSASRTKDGPVPQILDDLSKLENPPRCLMKIAYEWCSVIYENRQNFEDWESLLLLSMEIGFRRLGFQDRYIGLVHTENHRELVVIVFKSQDSEAIADLLHAWTTGGSHGAPPPALLGSCTENLVVLHNLVPFSPRLRRLAIRFIELVGYKGFEGVGADRLVELLNHLRVTVEDMDEMDKWARLLLDALKSSEGAQRLSHWYLELLAELAISLPEWLRDGLVYSPRITQFLVEAQEWSKLEYWIGTVWMLWPPGANKTVEKDLGRSMPLLFRKRPGAAQKLEQWMERWSQVPFNDIPESFQRICTQAHEAAERDAL